MALPTSTRQSRLRCSFVLVGLAGLAGLAACSKSKNEAPPPLAASAAPEPAASAAAAPSDSAAAAPTIPPPIAGGTTLAAEPSPSKEKAPSASKTFGECCKALHKQLESLPPNQQGRLKAAAMSCDGIAKLVESGKTSSKDGYTSLRAALGGGTPLPAGCK